MDNKIITELCKPLPDSEIELRIGNVFENKGFSLLAYKTARADIKRLNDVCGLRWKNKFFYDEKKLLCCEILIYDEEIKEWIGRSDVGTESYTEKEKGSYSDARKRAGFSWGIGIELYKFPFIYIAWNNWYEKDGKKKPKGAYVQSWKIILDNEIMTIVDGNGKEMWNHLQKKTVEKKTENKPTILDLIHEAVQTYGDKMKEYLSELNIESPQKLSKLDASQKIKIARLVSSKCKELANEKKDTTQATGKPHYSDDNVPMGKHKGKKWSEVSNSYLEWVIENVEKGKPLRIASEKEYDLRNQADVSVKDTPKNEDFPF